MHFGSSPASSFFVRSLQSARFPTENQEAGFWFTGMFVTFCVYLVFFSSGYGFREVLPPLSFLFLLGLYINDYGHSTLSRLQGKKALCLFAVFLLWSVLTSSDPCDSFLHIGRGVNKQFLVFFLALECARGRKELRILAWMCLLGCHLQGLACVHQALTGFDIIHHDAPIANRLTGTMAWYWVGSYLLLAGIPALSLWRELRRKFGTFLAFFPAFALASPILFGIILGGARASFLSGLAVFLLLWLYTKRHLPLRTLCLRVLLALIVLLALLFFFGEGRFSLAAIFGDSRLTLWKNALAVWATDPWTGVGAWQYRPTFQALPLAQTLPEEITTLSHPHNVYLQVLCETGIVGFLACFGAIFFLLYVHGRHILHLCLSKERAISCREMAHSGFFFGLACLAFFVHGLVGHDFFRPWYQALFFCHLGIVCGTSTNLSARLSASVG